jgi:hypothetical protein
MTEGLCVEGKGLALFLFQRERVKLFLDEDSLVPIRV